MSFLFLGFFDEVDLGSNLHNQVEIQRVYHLPLNAMHGNFREVSPPKFNEGISYWRLKCTKLKRVKVVIRKGSFLELFSLNKYNSYGVKSRKSSFYVLRYEYVYKN